MSLRPHTQHEEVQLLFPLAEALWVCLSSPLFVHGELQGRAALLPVGTGPSRGDAVSWRCGGQESSLLAAASVPGGTAAALDDRDQTETRWKRAALTW